MFPQGIGQAFLPADALGAQAPQILGNLGPAYGVQSHGNGIRTAGIQHVVVQAQGEFGIFADGRGVTADFQYSGPVKHAESAGHDQQAVHGFPAEAARQESSQIFHYLHQFQRCAGQLYSADRTAIHGPYHTPYRNGVFPAGKQTGHLADGVRFQQTVSVHTADQWVVCRVQSGVQGISFAAVELVQYDQACFGASPVGALQGLTGQRCQRRQFHGDQIIGCL